MKKKIENLELALPGFANGMSIQQKQLLDRGEHRSLNQDEKQKIIEEASEHYAKFLLALGVDYKQDPNSSDTPKRVAKAYVNDLWKGRYELMFGDGEVTSFPSDGYDGIVLEKGIDLTSMCSHHHQTIKGKVHIAYIPKQGGNVVGLSKLNRVVEHFGRRGAIQEQLTVAIHNAIDKIVDNIGVMVVIEAHHGCISCRGVKHQNTSMSTSQVSGVFANHEKTAKQEVLDLIRFKI